MNLVLSVRQLPPIGALPGGTENCESRGYCGPFANQGFYESFPDAFWHGMGECVHCGTTRRVDEERPLVRMQLSSAA